MLQSFHSHTISNEHVHFLPQATENYKCGKKSRASDVGCNWKKKNPGCSEPSYRSFMLILMIQKKKCEFSNQIILLHVLYEFSGF